MHVRIRGSRAVGGERPASGSVTQATLRAGMEKEEEEEMEEKVGEEEEEIEEVEEERE